MNLKHQAKQLEKVFEQEIKKELPIALMPDGSLIYDKWKIKRNKQGVWEIAKLNGYKIDTFNLKACALMAAKLYNKNNIVGYNEIKLLDQKYQHNTTDSEIFKYRYDTSKDQLRRDLFLWRWEITRSRAKFAKQEISKKFRTMF